MIIPILFFLLIRFLWVFQDSIINNILIWRSLILEKRTSMVVGNTDSVDKQSFLYRDIRYNDTRPLVIGKQEEFTLYKRLSNDTSSLQGANIGSWYIHSVSLHPSYMYQLIVRTKTMEEIIIPINDLFPPTSSRFDIPDISEWLYEIPPGVSKRIQHPQRISISLRMI
jgi:hypothetical protein